MTLSRSHQSLKPPTGFISRLAKKKKKKMDFGIRIPVHEIRGQIQASAIVYTRRTIFAISWNL